MAGDRMAGSMRGKRDAVPRQNDLILSMNCSRPSQPLPRAIHNRYRVVIAVLAAMLMNCSDSRAKQDHLPGRSSVGTIQGTIRDTSGKPLAAATVRLEEKGNATKVETKTNAAGAFLLSLTHPGTYTVRAEKPGWRDAVVDALVLSPGDSKHVDLVLLARPSRNPDSSPSEAPQSSPGAIEFEDEPRFTVAGVTDWSNLGLHGSVASSRTSESLAKETQTLPSGEPARASTSSSGQPYEMALAFRDQGDFRGAREQVRKALGIAEDAEGHRLLGELDERLNDPLEAVREYEQATRMDPSEQNYFEWGTELLLHKAAEPAAEVFTRGFAAHPNSGRILTGLGVALYSNGSWDEAARRLCQASDLEPADAAPYLFLGKIEKATPAPLPCSEHKLARFAEQQPENALADYYYAISVWKRAKESENPAGFKEAEALLEKAVARDPRLEDAYLQLGILHFARGDFEQAIRDCKKAIEINPHLAEAHRQLGLIYQRTKERTEAQQEFDVYEQIEKADAAEIERQRKDLRQFLIILKDQPTATPPR
jgi:tetratricopeptide (TPR) repeat protein